MRNVLVTGASGCVGHYVVEALARRGDCRLTLVVRDPSKLLLPLPDGRAEMLRCDVRELGDHPEVLRAMDAVVHLATAWGDPVSYDINVEATLRLFAGVDPARCRRILYFSTASILDAENRPMPAAWAHGTDYIRSKYLAHQRLGELPNREHVTTLFPTLIFGGGDRHPISHLSKSIPRVKRALPLLKPFRLDGSFHFIHAADIARMVSHWLDHPPPEPDVVLGNAPLSVDELIAEWCAYEGVARGGSLDLTPLASWVAAVAGKRMTSWDRYSLTHRHFRYRAYNPAALGLAPGLETLEAILDEWERKRGAWPGALEAAL